MINAASKTALLLFAQSPEAEMRQKDLGLDTEESKKLFQHLSRKMLALAEKSGMPYFWMDESRQKGDSFATKLTNAAEQVFAYGYENLIIIGNDSYDLNSARIRKAKKYLENGAAVLGPSADGGDYLIGFSRKCFNPKTFENLPWQSSGLHGALRQYLMASGTTVQLLSLLRDLDDQKDLRRAVQDGTFKLKGNYNSSRGGCHFNKSLEIPDLALPSDLRAPPVVI